MQFSEVLLRLGCHLVGWLIIYTHLIWLGVIPRIECGVEGEELYRLSLVFSPFVIAAAFALGPATKLTSITGYLKWMALPLIVLIPLASRPVFTAFATTTLEGMDICNLGEAESWLRAWAPMQGVALLTVVAMVLRFVRVRQRGD